MQKINRPYLSDLGDTLDESSFVKDTEKFNKVVAYIDNFIDYEKHKFNIDVLNATFKNKMIIPIEYENEKYLKDFADFILEHSDNKAYFIPCSFQKSETEEMQQTFYPYLMAYNSVNIDTLKKSINSLISMYTGTYLILQENGNYLMFVENGNSITVYY